MRALNTDTESKSVSEKARILNERKTTHTHSLALRCQRCHGSPTTLIRNTLCGKLSRDCWTTFWRAGYLFDHTSESGRHVGFLEAAALEWQHRDHIKLEALGVDASQLCRIALGRGLLVALTSAAFTASRGHTPKR